MRRHIEFEEENGVRILVECEDRARGSVCRGEAKVPLIERSSQTFGEAMKVIGSVTEALWRTISGVKHAPTECEVTFGIKITSDVGVLIASTGAEANIEVTLKWGKD